MIGPDRQNAPGPSMLRRGQGLTRAGLVASPCLTRRRCRRTVAAPIGVWLEDELLPAMESFLARIVDAVFRVGEAFSKRSGCDQSAAQGGPRGAGGPGRAGAGGYSGCGGEPSAALVPF